MDTCTGFSRLSFSLFVLHRLPTGSPVETPLRKPDAPDVILQELIYTASWQ